MLTPKNLPRQTRLVTLVPRDYGGGRVTPNPATASRRRTWPGRLEAVRRPCDRLRREHFPAGGLNATPVASSECRDHPSSLASSACRAKSVALPASRRNLVMVSASRILTCTCPCAARDPEASKARSRQQPETKACGAAGSKPRRVAETWTLAGSRNAFGSRRHTMLWCTRQQKRPRSQLPRRPP
jgi:hypothetical protein